MNESRQCRGCPAQIMFVSNGKGNYLPLQRASAVPDDFRERIKGYYIVLNDIAVRSDQPTLEGDTMYVSHFQTCPATNSFTPKGARGRHA